MSNSLHNETSPYLLQHAENPVEWYPWGEHALQRARADDKPILLSIGYSACHWCHVMAHESFEDPETAELMNRLFVNVKVDREERPDIDKIYQLSHQLLSGRAGGWPLTVFLTPDDHLPIFAGTYFPRTPRYGMPAFADVLRKVEAYYREHRKEVKAHGDALLEALASLDASAAADGAAAPSLDDTPLELARAQLTETFDAEHGGFGGAPKFPHPTQLEVLLACWQRSVARGRADQEALGMARFSLAQMASRGLYDQLGGGFYRYCVDRQWQIPHFEKMLYDNAALLALYARAYGATGEPMFARIAAETAAWATRDMQAADGGFYSTLDADSEGEEGRFYLWMPSQFEQHLTAAEAELARRVFGLDGPPNFEARHWHLHRVEPLEAAADALGLDRQTAEQRLSDARDKLLAARNARVWPGRDEKVLTAWNGLMIRGLAIAARRLGDARWAEAATRAADFIRARLWHDGRLLATYKDGKARLRAYLDDHAFLADALLELLQCRWRSSDLLFARELADQLLEHYEDPRGGFYFTADDHEALPHRPKTFTDEATPAGNGVAAGVLISLGHLLAEDRYLTAAERALAAGWDVMKRYPHAHGTLLQALEAHVEPPEIIVVRGPAAALEPWQARLHAAEAPHRLGFCVPAEASELPGLLAGLEAGPRVLAYVCQGTSCRAPIASLAELDAVLGRRPADRQP